MSKENSFTIPFFANARKQSPNHPDFKLSFKDENEQWHTVGGIWKSRSKAGVEYLSLNIDIDELKAWIASKDKEAKPVAEPKVVVSDELVEVDDLPF